MGSIDRIVRVGSVTVYGRVFNVELTTWTDHDGQSFDVVDRQTMQTLTPESLDNEPTADDVACLLRNLVSDRDAGILDPFFTGDDAQLDEILRAVPDGEDGDLVDGAGHAVHN